MTDRDIVDEIDALVDAQLEQESSGYDHNLGVEYCPHCGSEWHGLPITERMQSMRFRGYMDPGYRYAEDTSRVLCAGSDVPASEQPERVIPAPVTGAEHTRQAIDRIMALIGFPLLHLETEGRWWRLDNPSDAWQFEIRREVATDDSFVMNLPPRVERVTEYLTVSAVSGIGNSDTVRLLRDRASGDNMYRLRYPAAASVGSIDSASTRPDRIEIFAARAPRLGGTWVPKPNEHEDHVHVVPPTYSEAPATDPGAPYLPGGFIPDGPALLPAVDYHYSLEDRS